MLRASGAEFEQIDPSFYDRLEEDSMRPRNAMIDRIHDAGGTLSFDFSAGKDEVGATVSDSSRLTNHQVLNGQLVFLHHVDCVITDSRRAVAGAIERWAHCSKQRCANKAQTNLIQSRKRSTQIPSVQLHTMRNAHEKASQTF